MLTFQPPAFLRASSICAIARICHFNSVCPSVCHTRDLCGAAENAGVENAGVENAAPSSKGGKRGSGKRGTR